MEQIRQAFNTISPLSDTDWDRIVPCLKTKILAKNELLVQEGAVCQEVYFIVKGLVRLYAVSDGKEICRQFFFENSFFSEYQSFLTQQPSKNKVDVLEDTMLYYFTYTNMQYFYQQIEGFQLIGRVIAENLYIKISERVNSFLTESPEERYQELVATRPKVLQRIPQYMIASYLGITPEHLSRLRKKMMGK